MPRCAVAFRTTGIGTSGTTGARPMVSLFAPAGKDIFLVQASIFNTTATSVVVALRRMTAQGTPGSGLTEQCYDPDYTPTATAFDVHTADATFVAANFIEYLPLPAAIGGGAIFTYGAGGLRIPKGTGNGVGWVLATGTGQICDCEFHWDE